MKIVKSFLVFLAIAIIALLLLFHNFNINYKNTNLESDYYILALNNSQLENFISEFYNISFKDNMKANSVYQFENYYSFDAFDDNDTMISCQFNLEGNLTQVIITYNKEFVNAINNVLSFLNISLFNFSDGDLNVLENYINQGYVTNKNTNLGKYNISSLVLSDTTIFITSTIYENNVSKNDSINIEEINSIIYKHNNIYNNETSNFNYQTKYTRNNDSSTAVAILFIGVFFGTSIFLFIFFQNIIEQKSQLLQKLNILNNKYKINYKINRIYKFYETCKSKRSLEAINLYYSLVYLIENNIDNIKDLLFEIKKFDEHYSDYIYEYDQLLESYNESNDKNENSKIFSKFELIIYKIKKLKKIIAPEIKIIASYTSPQGRNYYEKEEIFGYNDILMAFKDIEKKNTFEYQKQLERSKMTDSLRYDVLKRDHYRCKICGATALEGAKLHVDHIIPISKGGKTTIDNLQTLCDRCNMGKSNKF